MDVHKCARTHAGSMSSCCHSSIPYPTLLWASMQLLRNGDIIHTPHRTEADTRHVQAPLQGPFLTTGESQDNWQWAATTVA